MIMRPGVLAALVLACGLALPVAAAPILHATRGVVTALNHTELVISRARNRGDITIALSAGTRVDGALVIGAVVSVRYHDEGGRHVANAIAVEPSLH
jgi:hypothetical protein